MSRRAGARAFIIAGPAPVLIVVLAALIGLAACGGRPLAEHEMEDANEIPPGPGLVSGEDGALIFDLD